MSVLTTASKFFTFARAERRLLVSCAALLPAVAAAVRIGGFTRVHRWLGRTRARRATTPEVAPQTLAALVDAASRHLPIACSCLTRSLVLEWMLRRRGIESDLRLGVRLTGGRLEAHAWVECDGKPLNDSPAIADRFAPVF